MAIYTRRITWVDVAGDSRSTVILGNASVVSTEVALLNLSNADWALHSEAQLFSNAAPAPPGAQYLSVLDQATLWYVTSAGEIVQITLPAPLASIFLADGQTVDATSVAGVTATAIGVVVSPAGNPVTAFVGGTRSRQT